MILLKDLINSKIKEEFKQTVILIQGDLKNQKLVTDFDRYFTFFSDRGDWTPQDPILDEQKHPVTINDGIDNKGNPLTRKIYPIAILITDAINGSWQKSAELDAYSMVYNFEVIADDYDYDDIMLILSTHSDIYNQYRDSTTFVTENYATVITYQIPSFGTIQNAYGRKMFSSFMQFSMLFIKNGVLGNDAQLSLQINDATNLIPSPSILTGEKYEIVSVGTTDFTLIGAASNTVGTIFTATGSGTGTGTAYQFLTIPFITYSMTKSKMGEGNTFQGERIATMLHNQQTLSFTIGLIYTKSTLTSQILADIFDNQYLTKVYKLSYDDGTIEREYPVFLSDGSMVANQGEFITISTSWVLAKELS